MKNKHNLTPLLLLLPFLLLTALILASALIVLVQSLGYIPAFDLHDFSLDYYLSVLSDPDLLASLGVSLRTAFWSTVFSVLLGTAIAAALVYTNKTKGGLLSVVRLPILVPHMVVAMFMVTLFSQTGLLARGAAALGLITDHTQFPQLLYTESYWGVIVAYLWKEAPFVAYYVLSLMASVSHSLGEAAENLGASPLRSFFQITLPLTMPSICNAALIIFIFAFGGYELPFLLGSTLPRALPVQAYIDFASPDLRFRPYAMAANGVILFFTIIMAVLFWGCTRRLLKKMEGRS